MEGKTNKMSFLMGLFLGMAVISLIGFIAMLGAVFSDDNESNLAVNAGDTVAVPTDTNTPPPAAQLAAVADDEPYLGGKNAKVVIVEYTDFECPYCARHHDTMKQIISTYGNDIKYVLRHFPLSFHANAQKAAEAFECAAEQDGDKAYDLSDKMFDLNTAGTMSVAAFKSAAKSVGLNASKFNTCLDDGKYATVVQQEQAGGGAAGVDGTPATFINGQLVSGALPFENFQQIIDSLK
jgi:protein-disulfide isomerase